MKVKIAFFSHQILFKIGSTYLYRNKVIYYCSQKDSQNYLQNITGNNPTHISGQFTDQ